MVPAPETHFDKMPLGKIIDRMLHLRDEKSALDKLSSAKKAEFDELENVLIQKLQAEETTQGRSTTATATITNLTVPTIEDWTAFEKHILETEALYLLERRPAGAIYRELLQQGEAVPGLKPFTKTSISLRRL